MRERADGGNDRWRAGPEGVKLLIVTQSCEKVEVEGGRRSGAGGRALMRRSMRRNRGRGDGGCG